MAAYIVTAPVADYTGVVAGVPIVKGRYEGPLSAAALAYFQGAGYSVIGETPAPDPLLVSVVEDDPKAPTRSASKADWVAYAAHEDRGLLRLLPDAAEALTRDQLAEKFLGPKEA